MNEPGIVATAGSSPFDAIRRTDDAGEFWMARELQPLLGYDQWRRFEDAIERARLAAENSGLRTSDLFANVGKKVSIGSGAVRTVAEYRLTRYAAYLVAMNGDPRKPEIAAAQTYFAVKTREAEIASASRQPSRRELALLVIEAEDARELAEAQRDEARAELEVATPKAEAFDHLMDADGAYSMEAAAKALAPVTGGIGRNLLFRWLRQQGVLQSTNVPYQRYSHWFRVVLSTYTNRAGELVPTTTTRVLPAGVDGIRRLWLRTQALALTAEPATTGGAR